MTALVLVAAGTPATFRADVDDACRRLEITSRSWHPGQPLDAATRVIVGPLRAGARKVPEDLLEAAESAGEEATLVLLAAEPLVRPAVTLDRGRVVVLGTPATRARVHGVLRMLANGGAPSDWTPSLTPGVWAAHASPSGCLHADDGLAAVVPFEDTVAGDPARTASLLAALGTADDIETVAAIGADLGAGGGLVRLALGARSWLVYWPRPERPAWLHSLVRLPHAVDLSAAASAASGHVLRLPAHEGDVAFALGAPLGDAMDVALLAEHGAPAVLERIESGGGTDDGGGLLVEVR